jgi:transcriptional regulator with XRE-family HTH domain
MERAKSANVHRALREAFYLSARRGFPTDAALAEAFPVSPSRVARWKRGETPDAENARFLRDLGIVASLLEGYVEEEVIPDWLHGVNAHLGDRRPVDVLRAGRLSEVIRAIEAEKSGAFA